MISSKKLVRLFRTTFAFLYISQLLISPVFAFGETDAFSGSGSLIDEVVEEKSIIEENVEEHLQEEQFEVVESSTGVVTQGEVAFNSPLAKEILTPSEEPVIKTMADTAPIVSFSDPFDLDYIGGNFNLNVEATDDVGMGSYYVRLWSGSAYGTLETTVCSVASGGSTLGTYQNINCNLDTTLYSDGTYYLTAQFLDSSTQWGSDVISITIDNTAPVVAIDYLETRDRTPALTGTVDDIAATISVTVNGETKTATNNGDGTWTLLDNTLTINIPDGTYDVIVEATDLAGNTGTDLTNSDLLVDRTAPSTFTVNLNDNDILAIDTPVTFTGLAIDDLIGMKDGAAVPFSNGVVVRVYPDGLTAPADRVAVLWATHDLASDTWTIDFDPSSIGTGIFDFQFVAYDQLGNARVVSVADVEIYTPGYIQGRKFVDNNMNGNRNGAAGDDYLNGWTIYLFDNAWSLIDQMQTGDDTTTAGNVANGQFRFIELDPGTYYVCEENRTGWIQTRPQVGTVYSNANGVGVLNSTLTGDSFCYEITHGTVNTGNVTFGNYELSQINGYKYYDVDANGVIDGSDYGIENWTVFIDENANEILDGTEYSTTTDVNGYYEFEVVNGTYSVCEDISSDWYQTYPSIENCYTVTIDASGQVVGNINFANAEFSSIQGRKFEDLNRDGSRQAGEPRLDGWEIYLYDSSWNLVSNMLTGDDTTPAGAVGVGQYRFVNLLPDTYYICEEDRLGWHQINPNSGTGVMNLGSDGADYCFEVDLTTGQDATGYQFANFYDAEPPIVSDSYSWSSSYQGDLVLDFDIEDEFHEVDYATYEIIDGTSATVLSGQIDDGYFYAGSCGVYGQSYGEYDSSSCVAPHETVDVSALDTGNYVVRVCAADSVGNVGTGNNPSLPTTEAEACFVFDVYIDNSAPIFQQEFTDMSYNEGDSFESDLVLTSDDSYVSGVCVDLVSSPMGSFSDCTTNDLVDNPFEVDFNDFINSIFGVGFADTSVMYEGDYVFEYYAYDAFGNYTSTYTVTYTIVNVAPQILFGTNQTITLGQSASFSGSFTDPSSMDATPDDMNWYGNINFGDGYAVSFDNITSPGVLTLPSHTYTAIGTYSVVLTVCEDEPTDNPLSEGECSTSNVSVVVTAVPVTQTETVVTGGSRTSTPIVYGVGTDVVAETDDQQSNPDENDGEILGEFDQCTEDERGTLLGVIYLDNDTNDEFNEGDEVQSEVEVNVYFINSDGEEEYLSTISVNESSEWKLENLCAGEYIIKVNEDTIPEGKVLSGSSETTVSVEKDQDNRFEFRVTNEEVQSASSTNLFPIILIVLVLLLILAGVYVYFRSKDQGITLKTS